MKTEGFVLMAGERMPYSLEAIHAAGMSNGDRLATLSQWERLAEAEEAYYEARYAIYRAQTAALLGEPPCA